MSQSHARNESLPRDLSEDSLATHLHSRELALLDPAVRRDRAQVSALLAEDFQEFGASGRVWTRAQILNLLATETCQPPLMEDFECHRIAEGVALVTYQSVHTDSQTGECSAAMRSSLWKKESGEWRMRFHQGTRKT
jgi:hypothetical protein